MTTLEVGGPAWGFAEFSTADELRSLHDAARAARRPMWILGGGSNVVIADDGLDALVVRSAHTSVRVDGQRLRAGAGAHWDDVVAEAVRRGLQGIECLSGIPGSAGAAPVQNIGAYGQELADVLVGVTVYDLEDRVVRGLSPKELALGYRASAIKAGAPWLVLELELKLGHGLPQLRYPDLQAEAEEAGSLHSARAAVLRVRRRKSMVWDASDPNRRSVGSFFMNPVVSAEVAQSVRKKALRLGREPPPFHEAVGGTKLPAAWLIELSGLERGWVSGNVGLSTKHALCIVNRGGASAKDVREFSEFIVARVKDRLGVGLQPEARFVGGTASV